MSATSQNSIEVRLHGQRIPLRSKGDPERTREVLELVRARIQDAEKRVKSGAAPHYVALQALLDLAEEYVMAKRKANERFEELSERTESLLSLIEAELK